MMLCSFLATTVAFVSMSLDTFGRLQKIVVDPRERVQYICSHGKHFAYYNPKTQRVTYHQLEKEEHSEIANVFNRSCSGISDLDIYATSGLVYVAMASYRVAQNDHITEIVVIDPGTMTVARYPYSVVGIHRAFIRRCVFILYHGFLTLVSWSIDGTRSIHRLGSARGNAHDYPFKVYHVMVSDNTIGVLDNDFTLHVFYPDGGYRNMTVKNETTMPISACHFSVTKKQLILGFPDGTVRMHLLNYYFTKKFNSPIRSVYGDTDVLMVFLENGDLSIGGIGESLPEVVRWRGIFDAGSMHRFVYHAPHLIIDGDRDGFAVRTWRPVPSQKGLISRIQQATIARERAEALNKGFDFGEFINSSKSALNDDDD